MRNRRNQIRSLPFYQHAVLADGYRLSGDNRGNDQADEEHHLSVDGENRPFGLRDEQSKQGRRGRVREQSWR